MDDTTAELPEANDRFDSCPSKSKRKLSLLLVHGMGEQRPFDLIDTFAAWLTDTFIGDRPPDSVKLQMVAETSKISQPDIRVTLDVDRASESRSNRSRFMRFIGPTVLRA